MNGSGNLRVVGSVEARMGSSRLSGKMMLDLVGQPVILRVLERLDQAESLDGIVLATTKNPEDDVMAETVANAGFAVFRGSEKNVRERVVEAQRFMKSDITVEICGDCPLLDPHVVDLAVDTFFANDCDVVSCGSSQSYPQGTEVQVFTTDALAAIKEKTDDPATEEHVALYFHENPGLYRTIHLIAPRTLQAPNIRLQLDYEEDLQLIREVYRILLPRYGEFFGIKEVLDLLDERKELAEINGQCQERAPR